MDCSLPCIVRLHNRATNGKHYRRHPYRCRTMDVLHIEPDGTVTQSGLLRSSHLDRATRIQLVESSHSYSATQIQLLRSYHSDRATQIQLISSHPAAEPPSFRAGLCGASMAIIYRLLVPYKIIINKCSTHRDENHTAVRSLQ